MSVVISDTSPLHYLILCGVDSVLPAVELVIIPPTVFAELQHSSTGSSPKVCAAIGKAQVAMPTVTVAGGADVVTSITDFAKVCYHGLRGWRIGR